MMMRERFLSRALFIILVIYEQCVPMCLKDLVSSLFVYNNNNGNFINDFF